MTKFNKIQKDGKCVYGNIELSDLEYRKDLLYSYKSLFK